MYILLADVQSARWLGAGGMIVAALGLGMLVAAAPMMFGLSKARTAILVTMLGLVATAFQITHLSNIWGQLDNVQAAQGAGMVLAAWLGGIIGLVASGPKKRADGEKPRLDDSTV